MSGQLDEAALRPAPAPPALTLGTALANVGVLAERNLLKFYRNRQLVLVSIIQPLTNMMMFAYVLNQAPPLRGA